jgi:hypothetical protein
VADEKRYERLKAPASGPEAQGSSEEPPRSVSVPLLSVLPLELQETRCHDV